MLRADQYGGLESFTDVGSFVPLVVSKQGKVVREVAPFFHLPGFIVQGQKTVSVELRPFNDQQYNRDLVLLCERVNTSAPHLPDGRRLLFLVRDMPCPVLDEHKHQVA